MHPEVELFVERVQGHAPVIVLWILFFFLTEHVAQLISRHFPRYNELREHDKVGWDGRVVSIVHTVIVCPLALAAIYTHASDRHHVFESFADAERLCHIALGYFFWDAYVCITDFKTHGIAFLLHALSCLAVYLFALRPLMQIHAISYLMFELSSPFIALTWMVHKMRVRIYVLSAFLVGSSIALFFIVRLVLGNILMYEIWMDYFLNPDFPMPMPVRVLLLLGSGSLTLLNVVWFIKIVEFMKRQMEKVQKKKVRAE
eukprot:TRINITY_DN2257_c0_g1_i2.p1 TRINITY_DN2257_c0_g1~~TRINITY_DN2257_c0_g1_i2.p1  ORF type:complete len:258 (-),score=88.67 TRINITY_DN2257_c0_g1_i2:75-848(-)